MVMLPIMYWIKNETINKLQCNEKRYCRYNSDYEMFKDWAQGLPTAFNTSYYYNVSAVDLLADWLEETDKEKEKFEESAAEEKITWLIYRELRKGAAK